MGISLVLNTGSIILGLVAWVLAIIAMKQSRRSHGLSVFSFSACAVSLVLRLFEVSNRIALHDYAAIEDTITAEIIAAIILVTVTIVLNAAALITAKHKD